MSSVCFKTIGCRLNQAETAAISARFDAAGFDVVPFDEPADACVIHTCTITANAEKTCIRTARSVKKRNPACRVILAGCAVETAREKLLAESAVDLVADQSEKFDLPRILSDLLSPHEPPSEPPDRPSPPPHFDTTRALIKVQDGCDFCCAYCIVPAVRGAPRSLPLSDIVVEAQGMVDAGYKELVLTGANLGCYRDDGHDLVDLIIQLEKINDVQRLRLSSIESTTIERRIIDHMADSEKLCHALHIPLQSGDDGVLAAMGRRYKSTDYQSVIEYAIEKLPGLGLGTDIITGFPGETDAAFRNTLNIVKQFPFNNLHVFPYSIRAGTRAANLPDQVPMDVRRQRARECIELGDRKRQHFADSFIGRPVRTLIEKVSADSIARGWTDEYLEVELPADPSAVNTIVTLTPQSARNTILRP